MLNTGNTKMLLQWLPHPYYTIGYGQRGRIPYAVCTTPFHLEEVAYGFNCRQFNVYVRPNVSFSTDYPEKMTDQDIQNADVYVLDVDAKDNVGMDIDRRLCDFIDDKKDVDNHLLMFTGGGYQLWIKGLYQHNSLKFRRIGLFIKKYVEDATGLTIDFTPHPSRYGRYPGSVNYNHGEPRQGRIISWKTGRRWHLEGIGFDEFNRGGGRCSPSGGVGDPPKEEIKDDACGWSDSLLFIRSKQKRNDVLRIITSWNPTFAERAWMVAFLHSCGLSRESIISLIQSMNQWKNFDYHRTLNMMRRVGI